MGVRVLEGIATKKCAFCTKWYDPTNSAIEPVGRKMWDFNPDIRKKCTEKGSERKAMQTCPNFSSKI